MYRVMPRTDPALAIATGAQAIFKYARGVVHRELSCHARGRPNKWERVLSVHARKKEDVGKVVKQTPMSNRCSIPRAVSSRAERRAYGSGNEIKVAQWAILAGAVVGIVMGAPGIMGQRSFQSNSGSDLVGSSAVGSISRGFVF